MAFTRECADLGYVVPLTTKKERIKKESLLKILEHFAHKDLNKFFDVRMLLFTYFHVTFSFVF